MMTTLVKCLQLLALVTLSSALCIDNLPTSFCESSINQYGNNEFGRPLACDGDEVTVSVPQPILAFALQPSHSNHLSLPLDAALSALPLRSSTPTQEKRWDYVQSVRTLTCATFPVDTAL
jgi:hypothetical protein